MVPSGLDRRRSRRGSQRERKASRDVKKLGKQQRTYSFSPGRNESIHVGRDANRPPVPPLPANAAGLDMKSSNNNRLPGQKPLRATTLPANVTDDWQRVPTLHKRSAQDLPRRQSSKKRKEQHDREAEIKAMVPLMPTRAATDAGFGRLVKKDSKRMREGFNRRLQNPASDISLPTADSIKSSMSSDAERGNYWLNTFDVFAPRPTIRYSQTPRYAHGGSGLDGDSSDSHKRRGLEYAGIPEEKLQERKRIADLADDLDASELRELMERDQKRREKKKIADRIKMERKLARRQERQKQEEEEAVRTGTPPPPNLERGVLGREVADSGSGTSAVVTSSKRRTSDISIGDRGKHPSTEFHPEEIVATEQPPVRATAPTEPPTQSTVEQSIPETNTRDHAVEAIAAASPPKPNVSTSSFHQTQSHSGSAISHILELHKSNKSKQTVPSEKSGSSRWTSETNGRPPRSWTSFFKRHSREKRSSTPLSFSNTIRDQQENIPTPTSTVSYTPVWQPSQLPKRTMSKFREDLPELPISPPDSRVQSPEADIVLPMQSNSPERRRSSHMQPESSTARYDTPASGHRSMDALRQTTETPTSAKRSMGAGSPESEMFLTQSLASIDSEGSWLSGRRGSKRKSAQGPGSARHDSQSSSSLQKRYKEYSDSMEELGIAEDEYFSRLTPGLEDKYKLNRRSGTSTGEPVPSSDDEEGGSVNSPSRTENTKWGAVARHPTIIHRGDSARSREGILNDLGEGQVGEIADIEQPESPVDSELDEAPVRRATSIDLGKGHARHISAGSAKLLDLKPRASESLRRPSTEIGSNS
ncbi:hypothetical protein F5884DRAFT_677574 [Xylogone sp. PMI_703]|nr:hypothetical protein F5884DRAFT_677574 [Xylogone sp. PMI_703]